MEELSCKLYNEAEPKITELEKYINDLEEDLQTISNDWENLKVENETLENNIIQKKAEAEEIINVKDDQIKLLQDSNKRLIDEIEPKEKGKDLIKLKYRIYESVQPTRRKE